MRYGPEEPKEWDSTVSGLKRVANLQVAGERSSELGQKSGDWRGGSHAGAGSGEVREVVGDGFIYLSPAVLPLLPILMSCHQLE